MTFLSTCCCGTTKSPPPPPTGCPDVCCSSCMWGDRISFYSNPINYNDDLVLYQGINVGNLANINFDLSNNSPAFKYEYKKMASYWVWWNPSYMLNYTTNIPECESTEYVSYHQVAPQIYPPEVGNVFSLHQSRIMQGDACNNGLIPNAQDSEPDAIIDGFDADGYQIYYGGAGGLAAFFTAIKDGIAGGQDPFAQFFTGAVFGNSKSGPSKESGYPCSTAGEDSCCYNIIAREAAFGVNTPQSQAQNEYCNKMGVSPYRRRIMAEHFPWAWQIFAYNEGNQWPFIQGINYFQLNSIETSLSGQQISGTAYATPLRLQCLGFIQCEHHWGLGEAGACNVDYFSEGSANYPLSFIIPRRFIYGCSAIPFFEFDVHEYNLEYGPIDTAQMITNMRAFTAYFNNPIGNFGVYGPQPYPDENNTSAVRSILSEMASDKFVNILTKDWRQEAYEELIIAEQYYRESLGITGSQYDLFSALGFERPISINGTINEFRNLSDQRRTELIQKVFPSLGPIRKRRRALTFNGLYDQEERNEYVNVFLPYDIYGSSSADAPFMFRSENGDDVAELKNLQAMTYANVFTEAFKTSTWKTSYPDDEPEIIQRRILSLVARLSQITYTYMLAQPGRWDFSAWGPGLANSKPEDNWFYRKYGFVQGPLDTDFPSFSRVLAHSQINQCSQDVSSATLNVDFAWNPGTHCLFGDCIDPDETFGTGLLIDPYCGRSTYSQHPDVFLATHSNGVKDAGESLDCPGGGGEQYRAIRPAGRSEVSFVRFKNREMKWDTSSIPFKVVQKTEEEKEQYNTTNFKVPLTKTRENCAICYGKPCSSSDERLYNRAEFKSFNASCAPSENVTSSATSDCAGILVENDTQIPYNNNNNIISYDFNWYGPIAFRSTNPYTLDVDQMFTIPGVTISNNCLEEYDFCERQNKVVHNAITANGDQEQWPFGLPQQRYWEAAPTYTPYGIPYGDFVGMFTPECCQLIEKCEDCALSLNFDDKCLYIASRWCRSPKYPQEAIEDWITSGTPNIEDFNFGNYSGVSGMIIGFGYGLNDPQTIDRRDLNPNTGNFEQFNEDSSPTNNDFMFSDFPEFFNSKPTTVGTTWGICTPTNFGLAFTSNNQFDCSKIMFDITEDQLRSVGMTNTSMIQKYKGSFCACEGIILDGALQTASFNSECKSFNDGLIDITECVNPVLNTHYTTGELKSLLNSPTTQHQFICKYLSVALCGGVDLLGDGLAKFRTQDAPCHLKENIFLYDGIGVTCSDTNNYFYKGICYTIPDPNEVLPDFPTDACNNCPGNPCIFCERTGTFTTCFNSCDPDPTYGCECCQEFFDSGVQGSFQTDCTGASSCGGILVYQDPLMQTSNIDFANWARSKGYIGCWKIKNTL